MPVIPQAYANTIQELMQMHAEYYFVYFVSIFLHRCCSYWRWHHHSVGLWFFRHHPSLRTVPGITMSSSTVNIWQSATSFGNCS